MEKKYLHTFIVSLCIMTVCFSGNVSSMSLLNPPPLEGISLSKEINLILDSNGFVINNPISLQTAILIRFHLERLKKRLLVKNIEIIIYPKKDDANSFRVDVLFSNSVKIKIVKEEILKLINVVNSKKQEDLLKEIEYAQSMINGYVNNEMNKESARFIQDYFVDLCYLIGMPGEGNKIANRAFQVLEPAEYQDIEEKKRVLRDNLQNMRQECENHLRKQLDDNKVKYRDLESGVKSAISIKKIFEKRKYTNMEDLKDLVRMWAWIELADGETEQDALMKAVKSILSGKNVPKNWTLRNYRNTLIGQTKPMDSTHVAIRFWVDLGEGKRLPLELQFRLANHKFAYYGMGYSSYKGIRNDAGNLTDAEMGRRIMYYIKLEKAGMKKNDYHALLLREIKTGRLQEIPDEEEWIPFGDRCNKPENKDFVFKHEGQNISWEEIKSIRENPDTNHYDVIANNKKLFSINRSDVFSSSM